jgi:hypothetical protein
MVDHIETAVNALIQLTPVIWILSFWSGFLFG